MTNEDIVITQSNDYTTETYIYAFVTYDPNREYGYFQKHASLYDSSGKWVAGYDNESSTRSWDLEFNGLTAATQYSLLIEITCYESQYDTIGYNYEKTAYIATTGYSDSGGGSSDSSYTPSFTNVSLEKVTASVTDSQIAVRFTGLDTSYKNTWKVSYLVYNNSTSSYISGVKTTTFSGGSTTSDVIIITGLSANTSYTFYGSLTYLYNDEEVEHQQLYQINVSTTAKQVDFSNVQLVGSTTTNSISVWVTGLDTSYSGASYWTIKYYLDYSTRIKTDYDTRAGSSTSNTCTFNSLEASHSYAIYADVIYYDEYGDEKTYSTDLVYFRTVEEVGPSVSSLTIQKSSSTDTSISVYVSGLDSSFTGTWTLEWSISRRNSDGSLTTVEVKDPITNSGSRTQSTTVAFTGLSAGYQYYIEVYVSASGYAGEWSAAGYFNTTGTSDTYGGAKNARLVALSSEDGTSISVYINGLDKSYTYTDRSVWWYLNGTFKDDALISPGASSTASDPYVFGGLSPGTTYTIKADIHYVNGDGSTGVYTIPTTTITTNTEEVTTWTVLNYGSYSDVSSSITRSFTISEGEVARFTIIFTNSGTAKFYSTSSLDFVGSLSTSTSFNTTSGRPDSELVYNDDDGEGNNFLISYDVVAGITYYLFVRCYSISNSGSVTVYIDPPAVTVTRPDLFEWDSAKTSGGTFNITASEWGRLLDNINAVRVYKGLAEMANGTTVGYFLYPASGDNFLALHYNQALMGIAGILGTGYDANAVNIGDSITADKINLLRDMINDIE